MAIENENAQDKARRAADDAARREAEGAGDDEAAKRKADEDKAFSDRLNEFYTKREKRTISQFEKMLDQKLALLMGKKNEPASAVDEDEDEDEEPAAAPAAASAAPAAPAAPAAQAAPDKATKRALKKLQETEKRLEAERERLAAEAEKSKASELRSATISALNEAECSNVKGALAVLKEDGRIGRDKEGNLVFLTPDGEFVDEEPLADGVKKWLESAEGKEYAKPRGVGGSGAEGQTRGAAAAGGAQRRSSKNLTKAERLAKAGDTLMRFARGGISG